MSKGKRTPAFASLPISSQASRLLIFKSFHKFENVILVNAMLVDSSMLVYLSMLGDLSILVDSCARWLTCQYLLTRVIAG